MLETWTIQSKKVIDIINADGEYPEVRMFTLISSLMIEKSHELSFHICARLRFEFPQLIYDVIVIQILFI
jgi:hypothetical protein